MKLRDIKPVVVGISGASGVIIAKQTVDELLKREIPVNLVYTKQAVLVWQEEMDVSISANLSEWRESPYFTDYTISNMKAPIASGTYPTRGMVVVPCSMASIGSMSHGISNNLLLRSADVCLKERRRLVVVPRETPLHSVHLENMLTLARLGVVILPPEPAFYLKPTLVSEMVRFFVARIMVALGLDEALDPEFQYTG